jgi:outer membrane protein TolC
MKSTKRGGPLFFGVLTLLLASFYGAAAQSPRQISLEEAWQKALAHYPLTRQRELLQQTEHLTLRNLNRGNFPQLLVSGQATYQSEVTQLPGSLDGFRPQPLSKDQYKVVADLSQVIYDGGVTRAQKNLQQLSSQVDEQRLEVELYRLRERIHQVYLGILLLERQTHQSGLIRKDLEAGISKARAQVKNGVAFRSSLEVLQAESLKADQREGELQASRLGLIRTLGLFLNEALDSSTVFLTPAAPPLPAGINRPELGLYKGQALMLAGQKTLIGARSRPRLSLFGQWGYGRPGFNFLRNEFDFFSLAGLRFTWALDKLYTLKAERRLLDLSDQTLGLQRETFILNTNTQLIQQLAEVEKLEALISSDHEIIALRESVKKAAQAQLANSVITSTDYIREVLAEDQARQTLILHQLQLLQAQITYHTLAGF